MSYATLQETKSHKSLLLISINIIQTAVAIDRNIGVNVMANTKVAEPGASDQTAVAIDRNTLARLKVLAGNTPVAQYLLELIPKLADDIPPPLEDLAGGYSLAPIHKKLEVLHDMVTELAGKVQD